MTLLCLAAIWLIGFGLVRWMFPRPVGWSLHNVLLFSFAIGAGAGIASCLYFLTLVLAGADHSVLAATIGAAVLIALALAVFAKRKGPSFEWLPGPPVPWYVKALLAVAVVLAVTMFLGAVFYNPHGDEAAWSVWNLRARFLFRAGPQWRDAFLSDLKWTHLDYPLLLPGLVAMCWSLARGESVDAPIAIAFLFTLGAAGVLTAALGHLRGKTQALLGATVLLGTASYIALSAALYGDVPLSFYILATLALFWLQDHNAQNSRPGDWRFSVLAGLMAGLAAWTRNEGAIFVVAVILARSVALASARRSADLLPQIVRFIAGAAMPVAIVIYFKLRVGGASDLLSESGADLLKHLADPARWILTAQAFVVVLFTFGRFLLPMVLALALYWYLVRFRVEPGDRTALVTAAIALALTIAAQLLIDIAYVDNLPLELSTSLERMFLHVWPAALLMFFGATRPLELIQPQKTARKQKQSAKPARHARTVAETR